MTYIPHEWESNELITHEKLNHMEDNIGKCVAFVDITEDDGLVMGKTWAEIKALVESKAFVVGSYITADMATQYPVSSVFENNGDYVVSVLHPYDGDVIMNFATSSSTGYPTFQDITT